MPEEDDVIIEFAKATILNPWLTWQNCADCLNQRLEAMGFEHRRSAEACRERWDHYLKKSVQCPSQFHKPRVPGRRSWTEGENGQFVKSVRRYTNNGQTNWEAVARDMGDRTAAQCRAHYKMLVSHGLPSEETPEDIPVDEDFEGCDWTEDENN